MEYLFLLTRAIEKQSLDALYFSTFYSFSHNKKLYIKDLIFNLIDRNHFSSIYRLAVLLSRKLKPINFCSAEFQRISFLFQKCRLIPNSGFDQFLNEFYKTLPNYFSGISPDQNSNLISQSDSYFCRFKLPFKSTYVLFFQTHYYYFSLYINLSNIDDFNFPVEMFSISVLSQFQKVPFPQIRDPAVSEGLTILRVDKNSKENQTRAIGLFFDAAQRNEPEGCFLFSVMTILQTILNGNRVSLDASDLVLQFLESAIQQGHFDALCFLCLIRFPYDEVFKALESMGNQQAKFWYGMKPGIYQDEGIYCHYVTESNISCAKELALTLNDLYWGKVYSKLVDIYNLNEDPWGNNQFQRIEHELEIFLSTAIENDYSLIWPDNFWTEKIPQTRFFEDSSSDVSVVGE